MESKVYFIPLAYGEDPSSASKKMDALWDSSGAGDRFGKDTIVAVKTHFGESDNTTFINPVFARVVLDKLKKAGCKPFLAETSTLYRGSRSNAIDHISLAQGHGFGFEAMGAPVIMVDGVFGDAEEEVEINGKHFNKVNVAREIAKVHGLVVLSHFTGHIAAGFGAAIKNLGMGLSSRRGKLKRHSVMSPRINSVKCTACGACVKWCPADTISLVDGKAFIHKENCIGCGECFAVCAFGAVLFDWKRESLPLQELRLHGGGEYPLARHRDRRGKGPRGRREIELRPLQEGEREKHRGGRLSAHRPACPDRARPASRARELPLRARGARGRRFLKWC
jgi:hypothetical protein